MPTPDAWAAAALAATAAHAGFQLTVTMLVYPALGDAAAASWVRSHARHSHRIVPLVGLVYLSVLVTTVGSLVVGAEPARVVSAAASALVVLLTACSAAPLHRRLTGAWDPRLFARLRRTDRWRTLCAVLALAAAMLAALG